MDIKKHVFTQPALIAARLKRYWKSKPARAIYSAICNDKFARNEHTVEPEDHVLYTINKWGKVQKRNINSRKELSSCARDEAKAHPNTLIGFYDRKNQIAQICVHPFNEASKRAIRKIFNTTAFVNPATGKEQKEHKATKMGQTKDCLIFAISLNSRKYVL